MNISERFLRGHVFKLWEILIREGLTAAQTQ